MHTKETPHTQYRAVFKGRTSYTVSCCIEGPHTRYPVVFKRRVSYTVPCCIQRKGLLIYWDHPPRANAADPSSDVSRGHPCRTNAASPSSDLCRAPHAGRTPQALLHHMPGSPCTPARLSQEGPQPGSRGSRFQNTGFSKVKRVPIPKPGF